LSVDQNDTIRSHFVGIYRTDASAFGMDTMIAGNGQIVGKNGVSPGLSSLSPLSPGDLIDAPPEHTKRQVVLVLTGILAGFATRA
jgi:hypothetical protein